LEIFVDGIAGEEPEVSAFTNNQRIDRIAAVTDHSLPLEFEGTDGVATSDPGVARERRVAECQKIDGCVCNIKSVAVGSRGFHPGNASVPHTHNALLQKVGTSRVNRIRDIQRLPDVYGDACVAHI